MKFLSLLLSLSMVGIAAAFFRPAEPHQVAGAEVNANGGVGGAVKPAFFDEGLDNPNVQADDAIDAARKCGFCMGWSGQTNCPVSGL